MIAKSMRKQDTKQEKIINSFLYDNFFTKVNKTSCLIEDKELQIAGVDLQMKNKKDNIVNIDIKAQSSSRYINNPRPTFVLELSSLNCYQQPTVGWFLNTSLVTDYYSFVWINDAVVDENNRIASPDNINEVEIMTVSRKHLKEYMSKLLGDCDVDDVIEDMRNTGDTKRPLAKGVSFSHTPSLFEKPVNLVVHKNILKKFAISHCRVTQGGIYRIQNE